MSDNTTFSEQLVDPTAYRAPGAVVIGDTTIGAESSVWFSVVIRGDTAAVRIGSQTSVQDAALDYVEAAKRFQR